MGGAGSGELLTKSDLEVCPSFLRGWGAVDVDPVSVQEGSSWRSEEGKETRSQGRRQKGSDEWAPGLELGPSCP